MQEQQQTEETKATRMIPAIVTTTVLLPPRLGLGLKRGLGLAASRRLSLLRLAWCGRQCAALSAQSSCLRVIIASQRR